MATSNREYSPIDLSTLASSLKIITDSQELYVDPEAGSDTSGDGSIESPWASIYKALNYLSDKHLLSDVLVSIRLRRGVHIWDSPVNFGHPQGNQINIIGDTPHQTARAIGNRYDDDRDGIFEYIDTSGFTPNTDLANTWFDPSTRGCVQAGQWSAFPEVINPVAGAEDPNVGYEEGSRYAMFCRPYVSDDSSGVTINEEIVLRSGPLSNNSSQGPNNHIVIHPWNNDGTAEPFTVQGMIRQDFAQDNLGGSDLNLHGPNIIQPLGGEEPEYPTDMTGRFQEDEASLRRMYALGVHRCLGISAGVAGDDNFKDFILENLNTNRNQFRTFPDALDSESHRLHDLSDPASGDPHGKAYGELNGFLKFNYIHPKTYVYMASAGDALLLEGNRSIRTIDNICFLTVDKLASSYPSQGAAIHADNGSTINIGDNIHISGYHTGIKASSGSSISWACSKNSRAPIITKCENGVLATNGSTITLSAVCTTGCDYGIVAEKNSTVETQDALTLANTNHGFFATDNSHIKSLYSYALYNGQKQAGTLEMTDSGPQGGGSGFLALNNSSIICYGGMSFRSSGPGFHADKNSSVDCSFSDSLDNLGGGVVATNGSTVRAESVFVKQPGVVGFYAYNNSTLNADYACTLWSGLDGPVSQDDALIAFGDGAMISKNSSFDGDGFTAERAITNQVVVDINSSFVSAVPPTLRTLDPSEEGQYSVVASNGSKVIVDLVNPGDINSIATSYDASVRWQHSDDFGNYIVIGADFETPLVDWVYEE